MKVWPTEDQRLVDYLLGRLTPEEQAEIDERAFVDDGFEEQLEATSDDLIHAYLAGTLSSEDRAPFEEHFLASPRRRDRLAFVKDLLSAVEGVSGEEAAAPAPGTAPPGWSAWALRLAAILVAALAAALFFWREGMEPKRTALGPSPSPPTETPVPRQTPTEVASPAATSTPAPRERVVRLGGAAGTRPAPVSLAAGTRAVRLEVPVEEGEQAPAAYDAVLRTARGDEVWRAEGVTPASEGAPLVLEVPARLFADGDYQLEVAPERLRDASETPAPPRQFRLRVVREGP